MICSAYLSRLAKGILMVADGAINPFSLVGKRILITGASSGIGRACAIVLSQLGASIVGVGRRVDALEETLACLAGEGHHIQAMEMRCADGFEVPLKKLAAEVGRFDGLIHSAGIATIRPVRFTSIDSFREIQQVNVEAAYFLAKAFRHKSVRSELSSVVFIGSVMSLVGQPGLSAYAASKGALVPLAKCLALEFAADSIRVNVVAPGQVATAMETASERTIPSSAMDAIRDKHPLGIGDPKDVAYACAYLISAAARWVTGTTLVVDGGYTAE